MRTLTLITLFLLSSCKGHRFYWETRFVVTDQTLVLKEALIRHFKLTGKMSDWHPVFGEYCMALPKASAHLFVCWKNQSVKVASSYNGTLKGDQPVIRKKPRTVQKYLKKISDQSGYAEHAAINDYIHHYYQVHSREDRLLTYGRGSILMKEELDGQNLSSP